MFSYISPNTYESKKGKKAPTGGSGKGFKSAEFIKV